MTDEKPNHKKGRGSLAREGFIDFAGGVCFAGVVLMLFAAFVLPSGVEEVNDGADRTHAPMRP